MVFVAPLLLASIMFGIALGTFPRPSAVRDAYTYLMTAQRLVVDRMYCFTAEPPGTPLSPNAKVTPGWPIFLAGVYAVAGVSDDPIVAARNAGRLMERVLFLCTLGIVIAVAMSARLFGGDTLGLVGGLFAALYLPFSWAASVALAEHLGALMLSISVYVALRLTAPDAERTTGGALLLGARGSLTLLVRPSLLLWAAAPAPYLIASL